jgi:MtN3 and saliva related transmembrane protein
MDLVTLIGSAAATLTTVAFIPQVAKAHRSRETKDLSLLMYLLSFAGLSLWTVYGLCLLSLPIILANTITLVLCSYLIYLKLKHG